MGFEQQIPVLAAFAMVALFIGAAWLFFATLAARKRQRLAGRLGEPRETEPEGGLLAARLRQARSGDLVQSFRLLIERTGLEITPGSALLEMFVAGLILAVVAFFARMESGPLFAVLAFLIGAAIPLVFFLWKQRRYLQNLQAQLPDALFLLARSLRAGRPLDHAFQLVGEYGAKPLSREFARMHQQLELGIPLDQVTHGAATRLGLVDFNVFASVVSLHRTTGGNLPVLLDRLAISTRDRVQFEGQYRATTVMGRYSAGFIGFLACVILIYFFFFQKELTVRFFDTSVGYTGVYLFATAIGLELAGVLLLFWLLKYEY